MSLSTTANKVIGNGNGVTTVWPYTFPIPDASYLSVIYTDASGVETTLSASLYSVTGIGTLTGGNVTYPLTGSPIATGTKLTIVRTVPYTQTTVFSNQGGYYPEVVEQRFDYVYMAMQQLAEIVSRYTTSSISNPATEQSNYALIQALQAWQTGIDKLTTAGDMLTHTGSAYARLARGGASQFLGVSGTALAWRDIILPKMHIYGLTLANNGTDATNDLDIAAGGCMDDTHADWIQIAATTKQTDAVWAADNGATATGGLDLIGSAGNNEFYVWAIKNPTTGATGTLLSLSATAPTMPSGYTLKRLVNWVKRSGGAVLPLYQMEMSGGGLRFHYVTPIADVALANTLTSTRRTDTLSVPKNFSVLAHVRILLADGATAASSIVTNPSEVDQAVVQTAAVGLASIGINLSTSFMASMDVLTSAAGAIAARTLAGITVDSYGVMTFGFTWSRR